MTSAAVPPRSYYRRYELQNVQETIDLPSIQSAALDPEGSDGSGFNGLVGIMKTLSVA
jgi:hypothetical protein